MNFQISPDVRALADALIAVPIGETITYAALSDVIGGSVEKRRWLIPAALRLANEEAGAIYSTQRRVGFQRMPAADAGKLGATARQRVRRITKRTAKRMQRAIEHGNDIPEPERLKIMSEMSALFLLSELSRDRQVRALPQSPAVQPLGKSLAALLANLGGG